MLTPEYLEKLPNELLEHYKNLEDEILKDIIKKVKKAGDLTATSGHSLKTLIDAGYNLDELEKYIVEHTKVSKKILNKTIVETGILDYENQRKLYFEAGKDLTGLQYNRPIQNVIQSMIIHANGELDNITQTIGMEGNLLKDYYRNKLNQATMELSSGAFNLDTILDKTIKEISDRGIITVGYTSRNLSVEAAVRLCLTTTVNSMSSIISMNNAIDMGQDLMEITAHSGARPEHANWQGKIVSLTGKDGYLSLEDIGYGEPNGFQGCNCRHNWYPFFDGISTRAYSEKELERLENETVTYYDEEIPYYKATQRLRQMERSIRKSKRQIIMYEEIGMKDKSSIVKMKMNRKLETYKDFSNRTAINVGRDRLII